eukprot:TRINITY_DN5858_c1_g4_i1.p1 TRINITY_DN5858_c1_g4~~TRINITY_DN5858_c1_g4_i1.p1  ORF type:complete len:264 (-),score=43.65 TRINITY_DN5858_c1_g4_i1:102-869(-)
MLNLQNFKQQFRGFEQVCGILLKISKEQQYQPQNFFRQHQTNSNETNQDENFSEQQQQQQNLDCWHCGKDLKNLKGFFCGSCKGVQPARLKATYFEVMGIPKITFDIDLQQLDKRYKALQFLLHPDKFEVKSDKERQYSLQQASLVNSAYNTLKNPLARAKYLCKLYGWQTQEEEEGTIEDPELLMQIMEEREAVEETADQQLLQNMRQSNMQKQSQLADSLASAFQNDQREEIKRLVTELTYVVRLGEEILNKI